MTQLTDADYDIDLSVLYASLGIDPGMVVADSGRLQFADGKALLTYQVIRAIPPRLLGMAMLRSAKEANPEPPEMPEGDDPRPGTLLDHPTADTQEPPRPKVRARTTKKAPAKKAGK